MKKTLSIILAVLMIVTMMPFTLPAKAASIPVGETIYLKPGSYWSKDEARFAAYIFGDGYCWVDLEVVPENDSYYQLTVPEGTWDGFLFCRMVPGTVNDWANKWNQTTDLFYDGVNNLYSIAENSDGWDGMGTWSQWSPEKDDDTVTVYLLNAAGWATPKCYYWNNGTYGVDFPVYPGEEMEFYGNDGQYDIYTYKIPAEGLKGFFFIGANEQTREFYAIDLAASNIFDTAGNIITDYCVGHEWNNGVCDICKKACDHAELDEAAKCIVCGKICYMITRQPSAYDLSVEVNVTEGTTYQWIKKSERKEKEITDKNAIGVGTSPTNTDVTANYESDRGWISASSYGDYSPVVKLYCKEGDIIRIPAEGSVTKACISDSFDPGRFDTYEYETAQEDGNIYIEIENEGYYYIIVDIVRGEFFKAYITTDGEFEEIDGATDSVYFAEEIGEYYCVVRFADGTEVNSDTVAVTTIHICDLSGEWEYDDEVHWKNCTDVNCDKEQQSETHIFTDGVCDVCEMKCCHLFVDIDKNECSICLAPILTGVINSGDEIAVDNVIILEFIPTVSGEYTISSDSSSDNDPMVEFYYEDNCLAHNDDIDTGNGEYDFKLSYECEAGKVYKFIVYDYSTEFGFTVKLESEIHTCDFTGEWKYDNEKHWKECTCGEIDEEAEHTFTDGKCDCGYECPHEDTYNNLIRPVQNADATWGKGKIVEICNICGNSSLVQEVERDHEGYKVFDETALELEAILNSGKMTDTWKNDYTNRLHGLRNSAYYQVYTEIETAIPSMTESLKSIIAAIEAGLADGTMRRADFTYMTALFDEINALIDNDPNKLIPSESGRFQGIYYGYYMSCKNNGNHSQADYDQNMADNNWEGQIEAILAGVKDGTALKADYTEIDEAIVKLDEKLADENLTDEAKAELEEIKAELEEMKKNPLSSKADLAGLEKALEDYETEVDAGIKDGTIVLVDVYKILEEYDIARTADLEEKYGREKVDEVFLKIHRENAEVTDSIYEYADSIAGTVAETADEIEELKVRVDALYAAIERCIIGTHNVEEYEVVSPAKCEANAIESGTCTLCVEVLTREVENSALKHSFTKYEVTEEAKCGVEGKEVAVCDHGCGETDEKAIEALEHLFIDYIYNEDATCTADGTKTAECVYGCGETDTVTAEDTMLDHADEDGDKICDDCESEIKDVCPHCGRAVHEGQINEYICILIMFIKLVVSLVKTLQAVA